MHPAMLTAYRKSSYEVAGIHVRVGRRSPGMDVLLRAAGVREAAFVTAFNPYSRRMPPGWNRRMLARLVSALRHREVSPGTGSWRRWSESHLIVFGDTRPTARLARRFRQNGIVTIRLGQPALIQAVFESA